MKTLRHIMLIVLPVFVMAVFTGCDKTDERGTSELSVKMVDSPIDLEAVFVDVMEVQVNYERDDTPDGHDGWVTLATNGGVYDLLELQNGVSVLLTDKEKIPSGKISQIRLILGTKNAVVISGSIFPLATPSAQSSGLKINVHEELKPDTQYEITLDFDATRSVVFQGNGGYSLRPVITIESIVEI